MLTSIARILLTATAVAPVSLTYAVVAWYQEQNLVAVFAFGIAATLTFLCWCLIKYVAKNAEPIPFRAQTIEPADAESLGFMMLYLLPLFTDDIKNLNWELWLPTLVFFSVIVGTGYGYHFNPLLGLLRWHFYKVTSNDGVTFVLITRQHLRKASGVHRVGQLTEYVLLDLE